MTKEEFLKVKALLEEHRKKCKLPRRDESFVISYKALELIDKHINELRTENENLDKKHKELRRDHETLKDHCELLEEFTVPNLKNTLKILNKVLKISFIKDETIGKYYIRLDDGAIWICISKEDYEHLKEMFEILCLN